MDVRRPVLVVLFRLIRPAQRGDIVGERVDPYVHYVLRVVRHRDAPVECASRNAEILKALLDEAPHLVSSCLRLQEFRMLVIELQDLVGVVGQLEEICFLTCLLNRPSAIRAAAVDKLRLRPECLALLAVETFISAFIDIALIVHPLPDLLDPLHVPFLSRPDEVIIRDLHGRPQVLDARDYLIDILLRSNALFDSLGLDLLTVLICSREEHDVVALQPLEACHGVSHDRAVGVSDVQVSAWVVDRCSDVVSAFVLHCLPSFRSNESF